MPVQRVRSAASRLPRYSPQNIIDNIVLMSRWRLFKHKILGEYWIEHPLRSHESFDVLTRVCIGKQDVYVLGDPPPLFPTCHLDRHARVSYFPNDNTSSGRRQWSDKELKLQYWWNGREYIVVWVRHSQLDNLWYATGKGLRTHLWKGRWKKRWRQRSSRRRFRIRFRWRGRNVVRDC